MTTAQLRAILRTQLADAQRPGLAGVRALEGAAQTVDALEDAVTLTEQLGATREAARYGEMLRHMSGGDPAKVYAAERAARAEKPELWTGVLEIGKLWYNTYTSTKESSGGASNTPLPDQVLDWRT